MSRLTLRFSSIVSPTYVDGPGRRAALFVQGCSIRCPGCQNRHLWPASGGHLARPAALAQILAETELPITISGGEPFDQAASLYALLWHVHNLAPRRHIILYSGRTFEALVAMGRFEVLGALVLADILVDGPYIQEQDDAGMQYRGSRNQRVIDLATTLRLPAGMILCRGPMLLDWDTPELILTDEGDLLGASPLAAEFREIGVIAPARRCGECRERIGP